MKILILLMVLSQNSVPESTKDFLFNFIQEDWIYKTIKYPNPNKLLPPDEVFLLKSLNSRKRSERLASQGIIFGRKEKTCRILAFCNNGTAETKEFVGATLGEILKCKECNGNGRNKDKNSGILSCGQCNGSGYYHFRYSYYGNIEYRIFFLNNNPWPREWRDE